MPELPYAPEALAPKMSKETFDYHYGKHLQTYVNNLNNLIAGTPYEEMPLDEIVRKADGGIFNNAAQAWNHTFFFRMLTPAQQPMPAKLAAKLTEAFGSVEAFKEQFTKAAVGLFGSPALLRLLNTKEDLLPGAILYLRVYFLGMPALALYNYGNAVFSAIGETKKPLAYLSVAGVVNILLNLFFVIICKLDVAGVALASTIAQCLSAGLILHALTKVEDCYALDLHSIRLDLGTTKRILMLGIPAGLQNAIFAIANLFIQAGVNSFDSLMVKGNSAAANSDAMIYDAMAAFYMACASFMSQNYGAGKLDRMRKSYFISLAYSFGVGLLLGGGLLLFGRQFLALFTTESAVIDAGMKRIMVMGLAYCISAFMDCTIAASRGLGKTIGPTVIGILGSCVFRVIWVYTIFAHFHTIPSLYLLYPFSWLLTAAAEIVYFIFSYRQAIRIFHEQEALAQL